MRPYTAITSLSESYIHFQHSKSIAQAVPNAFLSAEGMTPEELIDHYPSLTIEDIRAALAYAAEPARENLWKVKKSS